jgi:hypothetical protein
LARLTRSSQTWFCLNLFASSIQSPGYFILRPVGVYMYEG